MNLLYLALKGSDRTRIGFLLHISSQAGIPMCAPFTVPASYLAVLDPQPTEIICLYCRMAANVKVAANP